MALVVQTTQDLGEADSACQSGILGRLHLGVRPEERPKIMSPGKSSLSIAQPEHTGQDLQNGESADRPAIF
jgi:hypothetical protein